MNIREEYQKTLDAINGEEFEQAVALLPEEAREDFALLVHGQLRAGSQVVDKLVAKSGDAPPDMVTLFSEGRIHPAALGDYANATTMQLIGMIQNLKNMLPDGSDPRAGALLADVLKSSVINGFFTGYEYAMLKRETEEKDV